LVDVRVGTGADQGVHLHTVAADLLCQITENAEAGDHRQRFGSRSPAGHTGGWRWPAA
jgi:hypothetical protein